jgi:MFS family permease
VYSITRPFSSGTFFSALAEIAGPELLDHASAIEASSLNFSFLVGPALGGALAGAAGPATAVEVQAAITFVVVGLVAVNPAFEARSEQTAANVPEALRDGLRALTRNRELRTTGIASVLAAFGWGLMAIGFPLYALHTLHAAAHNSGYMWAAVAFGSIVGTFAFRGSASLRRIARSYGVLGLSALTWPLAHALALGILLIALTGFLEGPAYSGTIALRQRLTPPSVRAQVMTTLSSGAMIGFSVGAAIAGAVHQVTALIVSFALVNLVAALSCRR